MVLMKNLVFLFVLFFLFGSCKKDYKVEKIDSDVLVSANQTSEGIIIHAETEKIYSCIGHQITYCEKVRKNEIFIEFKKVKIQEVCLMALGPATSRINLSDLANGEYNVTFELNKKKTKGKLKIGTTTELIIDSGGNVKPK